MNNNERYQYRGKQITRGEWVYGVPVRSLDTHVMYMADGYYGHLGELVRSIVDPETISQYVGAINVSTEVDGIPIWEGDKVRMSWQHDGVTNYDYDVEGVVEYASAIGRYEVHGEDKGIEQWWPLYDYEREELTGIEVTGTKYDTDDKR